MHAESFDTNRVEHFSNVYFVQTPGATLLKRQHIDRTIDRVRNRLLGFVEPVSVQLIDH